MPMGNLVSVGQHHGNIVGGIRQLRLLRILLKSALVDLARGRALGQETLASLLNTMYEV